MRLVAKITTLAAVLALVSCGQSQQAGTERQKITGEREYTLPKSESELPKIELSPVSLEDDSLNLTAVSPENQALFDMLILAGQKIKAGVYSGNNLFAAGVSYARHSSTGTVRCAKVQIQQRSGGKLIVKDELVPAGQPTECKVSFDKGLSTATLGLLIKIQNNWAAGIGVGAVAYDGRYIAGCAAGAVGYILADGTAAGTYGGFCTQILDTTTGTVY